MQKHSHVWATALLLLVGTPPLAAEQDGLDEARASLLQADSGYSALAAQGFLPALARMLDTGVVFLEPGAPVMLGKDSVLAYLAGRGESERSSQTWQAVRADVSADGLDGYTYGFAEAAGGAKDNTARRPGKYMAYWRREPGKPWRVLAYVRAFLPATEPAPAPAGFGTPGTKVVPFSSGSGPAALRISVMDADRAFAERAASAGMATAFADYAAPDGAMLSGRPGIVYGPAAIRTTFAANFPANGRLLWEPVEAHVAGSGDLAFTVGQSETHTVAPDGSPQVSYGKYLTVWSRTASGDWRFQIDGGNGRPEASGIR